MSPNSNKPIDVAAQAAEAGRWAEFAEFEATLARAGVHLEPVALLRGRAARGTIPPESVSGPFDDFDDELDDDFHDAITVEFPVLTLRSSQHQDRYRETAVALEQDEYVEQEARWPLRRRNFAWLFASAVALPLLAVAVAVWWAVRADSSSTSSEPAQRPAASAPAPVLMPAFVVDVGLPITAPYEVKPVVAAPHGGDGE